MVYPMGMVLIMILLFLLCVALPVWVLWQIWAGPSGLDTTFCYPTPETQSRPNHPTGQTYQERQEWNGPR